MNEPLLEITLSPRFCPRCRETSPTGALLCPRCGDRVRDQGFCGVCDDFWLREVGEPCPKHEIPLEDRWDESPPFLDADADWVTVGSFASSAEAEVRRIRLEAEGIPTFLDGQRMGMIYDAATGGVKLQVPGPLVAEARVLLDQSWASPPRVDDLEDAWDDLEGSTRVSLNAKSGLKMLLWAWLVVSLVVVLASLLGR